MRRVLAAFSGFLACLAVAASAEPATPSAKPAADPIGELMGQTRPRTPTGTDPVVIGVRIGEHPDKTRFVVELSDPVTVRVFTLASPNRIVIDMPSVMWRLEAPPHPTGNGAVR